MRFLQVFCVSCRYFCLFFTYSVYFLPILHNFCIFLIFICVFCIFLCVFCVFLAHFACSAYCFLHISLHILHIGLGQFLQCSAGSVQVLFVCSVGRNFNLFLQVEYTAGRQGPAGWGGGGRCMGAAQSLTIDTGPAANQVSSVLENLASPHPCPWHS
jgi:hypothetical protein